MSTEETNTQEQEGVDVNAAHFEYAASCGSLWELEDMIPATAKFKEDLDSELTRQGKSEDFIKGAAHAMSLVAKAQKEIYAIRKADNDLCKKAFGQSIRD